MPQSHSRVLLHVIFSTKDRGPVLGGVQKELHAYIAAVLNDMKYQAIKVGGTTDHVHLLFALPRTGSQAHVVGQVKTATSKWLKTKDKTLEMFHWQNGYGSFSVSQSGMEDLILYIENQEEHHKKYTFQQEYRKLLVRHEIEYDERYMWD